MDFIEKLIQAFENDENVDDKLEKAAGTGDPTIPGEDANDKSGNPGSPGDEGDPQGDPEPNEKVVKETGSEKEATDPDGNPGAPGDENGTADPEAMEALDGLAMELFGSANREATNNMSDAEVIKAYIEANKDSMASDANAKSMLSTMIAEYKKGGYEDSTGLKLTLKTIAGVPVIVTTKTSDDSIVDVQYRPANGGKKNVAVSVKAMRAAVGKNMRKAAKEEPVKESLYGLPKFIQEAMEAEVSDLPDVPETKVTDSGPEVEKSIGIHKKNNLIPIEQEKDAMDNKTGNTGDPATNSQTPVSPSGDTKDLDKNKFENEADDKSGNTGDPADNKQTPVSTSGDTKPLPDNQFEKDSNAKDGNPDSPGENGDPAVSFESFIQNCYDMMTEKEPGSLYIPQNMTLEQYATVLGYGEILDRALEAKLSAADRRALKDNQFGLPAKRKYPLHDKEHVSDAIAYFRFCPPEDRDELARNIIKAIRRFNMEVTCTKGNPFIEYYPKAKVVSPRRKDSAGASANA